MDIRCRNKLHARMVEDGFGVLEVACDSRWCGKNSGIVVLHRFDLKTGELLETLKFKAPHKPHTSKETSSE